MDKKNEKEMNLVKNGIEFIDKDSMKNLLLHNIVNIIKKYH
ncbi:hypothetical protein [Clostridium botulinum]|nr:hypothetical protein [Clostridium botulinum]